MSILYMASPFTRLRLAQQPLDSWSITPLSEHGCVSPRVTRSRAGPTLSMQETDTDPSFSMTSTGEFPLLILVDIP